MLTRNTGMRSGGLFSRRRRQLLQGTASLPLAASLPAGLLWNRTSLAANPVDLPWSWQGVHELNRITFGASHQERQRYLELGHGPWLEQQLQPETLDDFPLPQVLAQRYPALTWSGAQLHAAYGNNVAEAINQLNGSWLLRAVYSRRQLEEVMVHFWADYFNIPTQGLLQGYARVADDHAVFRPRALGRFPELLHAVARAPSMQLYLDLHDNRAWRLNENFARELCELYTLGPDGFSEADVREVARCFTGWGLGDDPEKLAFVFSPALHDGGPKQLFNGQLQIHEPDDPEREGRLLLDYLARHPLTARNLARRLCIRFVADDPPNWLINEVAGVYLQTDGDLRAMLRHLLTSPAFHNAVNRKLRRPFEFIAAACRASHAGLSDPGRLTSWFLAKLHHLPLQHQQPDGYPDDWYAWLGSSAIALRARFALLLSTGNSDFGVITSVSHLLGANPSPLGIAQALRERLLMRPLLDSDWQALVAALADGQPPTQPYARARDAERAARTGLALMLGSPYFQLR